MPGSQDGAGSRALNASESPFLMGVALCGLRLRRRNRPPKSPGPAPAKWGRDLGRAAELHGAQVDPRGGAEGAELDAGAGR